MLTQHHFIAVLAVLLPFGLLIAILCRLITFLQAQRQYIFRVLRENWRAIVLVFFAFCFVIFDIPYLLNIYTDTTSPEWKFWFQTATGNWSPDAFPPLQQHATALTPGEYYGFTLSASIAFWLNNAIIIVLVGIVWRLADERRGLMNFAQAVKNRDSIVRASMRTAFGHAKNLTDSQKDEAAQIASDAFNAGIKQWEERYLRSAVGSKEAERLLAVFHELPTSK